MEFDPFSGNGVATLEFVWEPCINKFGMVPPLVVCCVSQNDAVSVSVMRLNGLGDHEVESPGRQMSFRLPLAVVVVDRNNAVAKATIDANGVLGAVVGQWYPVGCWEKNETAVSNSVRCPSDQHGSSRCNGSPILAL
jgi:hypothetical protein